MLIRETGARTHDTVHDEGLPGLTHGKPNLIKEPAFGR